MPLEHLDLRLLQRHHRVEAQAADQRMRRHLTDGRLPPPGAVRIEEMINYFSYSYPEPRNKHPFSVTVEMAKCPWNSDHRLALVGVQGKRVKIDNVPPSNLVFLIDVSGSMSSPDKLPLLKKAFKLLIQQLREEDRVAIVVYAGSSGLVLPSTSCDEKAIILNTVFSILSPYLCRHTPCRS